MGFEMDGWPRKQLQGIANRPPPSPGSPDRAVAHTLKGPYLEEYPHGRTFQFLFSRVPLELSPPRRQVSLRGRGVGGDGVGRSRGELKRVNALRFAGHHDEPERAR